MDHAGNTGVLRLGERLGVAVVVLIEAVLLEPSNRPAAVGIEVTLLLSQHLVEDLVYQSQRGSTNDSFTRCAAAQRMPSDAACGSGSRQRSSLLSYGC